MTSLHENLTFRDGSDQFVAEMRSAIDETRHVAKAQDLSLSDFFKRPLLISTFTWTPANVTPLYQAIDPWTLFFGNKRNVNRVANYNLLTAKLHVKILINGNAFYYGRIMADYLPLANFDYITEVQGLTTTSLVGGSQRLHLYVNPTTSQGGTLVLPFIWPYNTLGVTASDWSNLGLLYFREMNQLRHANAATTPVTINVFAWAEDVVLTTPTTLDPSTIVAQSSEYDIKPSTVASAVAAAAGKLRDVPIIGPYAIATETAAKGASAMAKMFGFSRPNIIEAPLHMRPTLVSQLANSDLADGAMKLSLDSRQELTVDSSVAGVTTPDELSIKYIASKESYVNVFNWLTSNVEGNCLYSMRITPMVWQYASPSWRLPACAFAALPFAWWRGTMRYRFQIVCSGLHKGRLLFVYDPNYVNALETQIAFTRIIDLENETDFTIDIPWCSPKAFLPVRALVTADTYNYTTSVGTTAADANGVLGVYVLNSLTSPSSAITNNISINVFVSACDDFDVAVPTSTLSTSLHRTSYTPQSMEVPMDGEPNAPTQDESTESVCECLPVDQTHRVYFGESFPSFRALLKRYMYSASYTCGAPATAGKYLWRMILPNSPPYRGISTVGYNSTGVTQSNWVNQTLINYLVPAFLAVRGGYRIKYFYREDVTSNTPIVVAQGATGPTPSLSLSARDDSSIDAFMKNTTNLLNPNTFNGSAVSFSRQNPSVEVEFPYYKNARFDVARDPSVHNVSGLTPLEGSSFHIVTTSPQFTTTADRAILDRFVSVAEDFQPLIFYGAPPIGLYTIP